MCQVSVLIVDDEALMRLLMCRTIAKFRPKWRVEAVADPQAAGEALRKSPFRVIVCDHYLERARGADYLRELARERPQMVRILASGLPEAEDEAAGCCHAFFRKPPESPVQLVELIESLLPLQ